jgi:hypothetical protein
MYTLSVGGGHAVEKMVETLYHKPEGRGFETPDESVFSIYLMLPAALGPGVYSSSNRNDYQKHTNNVFGE